jgi:hypothetical protein
LPLHAFSKEKRKVKPSRRRCFPEGLEEDWRTSAHPNELRLLHRILMDLYNRGEPLGSMTSTPPLRRSDFVRTTSLERYQDAWSEKRPATSMAYEEGATYSRVGDV